MSFEDIPDELQERDQWLLWDADNDSPRRPHWRGDFGVSWSDPETWHTFEEAVEAASERDSWGIGYVTAKENPDYRAGLYNVIDIDSGLTDNGQVADWVPVLAPFTDARTYIEYSPSGTGLHIPVMGEIPDWWSDSQIDDHTGVDVLSNKFCTFTGDTYNPSGSEVAEIDPTAWLFEAYTNINNENPRVEAKDGQEQYDGDSDLSKEQVREALDHVDSDLHYSDWLRVGMAVYDWDSGSTGKQLFESWSQSNPKWDAKDGQHHIDDIWSGSPDGDVTVGTLVYHAKQGGWTPPWAGTSDSGGDSTQEPDKNDLSGWEQVKELFESKEKGTTTKGYDLAAKLLSENESFVANRETEELYYYEPEKGIYVRKGRSYIEELLIERIPGHINSGRTKNVFEQVRGRNYVDTADFNPPKGKVCVANGVLDLETRELEPHSPEFYFTAKFDANYNPDAKAPTWVKLLEDSTTSKAEMMKIEEFIGYTLEGWHHKREKNLVIVGPPQSGKSTVMDAVENLLGGMPSVAGLDPHQISENQFDGSALKDALLNARNDIDGRTIEDSGTLKAYLSGQTVKLEAKYADAEFDGPNAKHLYSANWLPAISGQDDSFYRRLLIVEFPNQVPDEKRDVTLGDKLEQEASGILNRALEARERLNEQGHFTNDRDRTETRHLWDSWRDSNKRFLHTQFEITADMDDQIEKKFYMRAYREFAQQKGYQLKSQRAVTQSFSWVPEIWVGDDHYMGIKLKDKDVTETTDGSQQSDIETIWYVIDAHTNNGDLVEKETVVQKLDDQIGADKVRNRIETMKSNDSVIEREGGKLELIRG